MILNKSYIFSISKTKASRPEAEYFELPEKVLQFGTGVLLRGLPDYFIDKANKQGIFNGRIVVVKSTNHGNTEEFDQQDNLYTLCIRGIENGNKIEENIICSAISRVLTAGKNWKEILDVAASPTLEIVISNTTEVGIQLIEDDVRSHPPISFPGKLLAVLLHRFTMFNGANDKGLVIVPTELIVDNGDKLEDIMVKLAKKNKLSETFIRWMQNHNTFCNSLVDCIVPGKPDEVQLKAIQQQLGYEDNLLINSEVYRLWAIAGDDKVKEKLSFAQADDSVVITPDINLHRELKLRLLNGTHTLSSGIAFLAGFDTVKSAMDNDVIEGYITNLMFTEIAPAIPYEVIKEQTDEFSNQVLDRFRNPHIDHQWISITANYSSKLKMRVLPVLMQYVANFNEVPDLIAIGFAAYIRFMKPSQFKDGKYYGLCGGKTYFINDTKAEHLAILWEKQAGDKIVEEVLGDTLLWGLEFHAIPSFSLAVKKYLEVMDEPSEIKKMIQKELQKLEA